MMKRNMTQRRLTLALSLVSITASSTSTLIHVTHVCVKPCRLDYCCSLYADVPVCQPGCLDWVLFSAGRLIGGIHVPKVGHVSICTMFSAGSLLSSGFRLWYSFIGLTLLTFIAPVYLRELCCLPLVQGLPLAHFAGISTRQNRAFSVVSLPTYKLERPPFRTLSVNQEPCTYILFSP